MRATDPTAASGTGTMTGTGSARGNAIGTGNERGEPVVLIVMKCYAFLICSVYYLLY